MNELFLEHDAAILVFRQIDARALLRLGKVSRYFRMMTRKEGVLYASILNTFPGIKDLPTGMENSYYEKTLACYYEPQWRYFRMNSQ